MIMPLMTFIDAINEALSVAMARDPNVICYGLGVDDPKGVFGTTLGLQAKFGPERVFDMPTSENAMTGIGIGAALYGLRPVMTHQRLDFALLSMDQLVNNAAKWRFMFGGHRGVPLTVRMIIGRGWGQGPQHSQALQAWFAHIPGLKVVMPTTPYDAKGMLIAAVEDDAPVIVVEHRWLYGIAGDVPEGHYRVPLNKARVVRSGADITLIGASYMTIESLRAAEMLVALGIDAEVIDLRSLTPIDAETLGVSVRKTGRAVISDTGHSAFGVAAEVTACVVETAFGALKAPPRRVALPHIPTPTTPALANLYYPRAIDIARAALAVLGNADRAPDLVDPATVPLDVPDPTFVGPY